MYYPDHYIITTLVLHPQNGKRSGTVSNVHIETVRGQTSFGISLSLAACAGCKPNIMSHQKHYTWSTQLLFPTEVHLLGSPPPHTLVTWIAVLVSHTTVMPQFYLIHITLHITFHLGTAPPSLPLLTHTLAFTTTPVLVFQHTIFTPSSLFLASALTSSGLGSCQTYNRPLTILPKPFLHSSLLPKS